MMIFLPSKHTLVMTLTVMVFGLSYGVTAPLIAIALAADGYSDFYIGLNAAMHAIGVFAVAPLLPVLCRRFSPKQLLLVSLGAIVLVLMLFPVLPMTSWFVLRLALGVFSEVVLVVAESWLNHTTIEEARARTMALYVASLSLGFALGPLILSWVEHASGMTFVIASLITLAAAVVVAALTSTDRPIAVDNSPSLKRYWQFMAMALVATALNGALESAGMNLLVIYAMKLGWLKQQATWLLSILLLGAIVLQLPIGWIADRIDRQRLIAILALLSTLGALAWPWALDNPWFAYGLLFVWGGVFVGIYTVVITVIGDRYRGSDLVGAYCALSVAWAVGALLGPVLGGAAMSLATHGLAELAAVLCGLFTLFAMHSSNTVTRAGDRTN